METVEPEATPGPEVAPNQNDSSNNVAQVTPNPEDSSQMKRSMKKRNMGLCNQELLKLVARGSAIICEIMRLKDFIPEPYINPNEEKLYKDIIFDFNIFTYGKLDAFENKLRTNQDLFDKDDDFRDDNIELIDRFYSLFDSIYQYITDWKTFVSQVKQGHFIQHTIDTILAHKELRQLFCESVFNSGVMLLLVDRLIPGIPREKLIVSYYRYKGQSTIPHFRDIFNLFARTGYFPPTSFSNPKDETRPKKYPADYFKRCDLDRNIVEKVIRTIAGNDIYDQQLAYPTTSDYQTLAYSQQGSLLAVILFFCPEILEKSNRQIFDIVSKHFHDNVVISFYMGYTIDIYEYWKDFKDAIYALDFNMKPNVLKENKNKKLSQILILDKKIKEFLNEGVMTEEYVLKNIENLLTIMRDSNLVLRWFILQRNITNKKFREIINEGLNDKNLVTLLLDLSQFEDLLKTKFQNLVNSKDELWETDKNFCIEKISELVTYYSGNSAFSSNLKLDNYTKYFEEICSKINELNPNNPNRAGVKIGKIKERLNNVQNLDKINESANARENIKLIHIKLDHMLLIVNIKRNYSTFISKISDFSYAWIAIHDYSKEMQRILASDSKNVLLLRATFLKLVSILNFPLIRLFEIDSEDIDSVTNYYSSELVIFVRDILQIIPISVFKLLDDVIKIFNSGFKEMPIKLEKIKIKDYSQNELRYKLSYDAHKISVFTKGIFMMEKTLMGVIEVDPKIILEKGIRRELLLLLANIYHSFIDFKVNDKINLNQKLNILNKRVTSVKQSFLYIQDYININGSKMWCEEMHKLINYYVELEANRFLSKKIKSKKRSYDEMKELSMIRFAPLKNSPESPTFLGRLTRYILNLTNPKYAIFCPANYSWYDKSNNEIFGIKILNKIKESIGIEGFQGLGKLLGYLNYQNLLSLQSTYNKSITDGVYSKCLRGISSLYGSPFLPHYTEKNDGSQLFEAIKIFGKFDNNNLIKIINEIGQICFLKKLQNYLLSDSAEVESTIINSEIKSLNEINLLILKNNININIVQNPDENNNTEDQNNQNNQNDQNNQNAQNNNMNNNKNNIYNLDNYYRNLCSFFEDLGYIDSQHIFYVNLGNMQYLPVILACITYNELEKLFYYDKKTGTAKKQRNENFDLFYFTNGIFNILYQMGKSNIIIFVALLSDLLKLKLLNQFTLKDFRTIMNTNLEIPKTIAYLQLFLKDLTSSAEIDLDYFEIGFNSYLMLRNVYN